MAEWLHALAIQSLCNFAWRTYVAWALLSADKTLSDTLRVRPGSIYKCTSRHTRAHPHSCSKLRSRSLRTCFPGRHGNHRIGVERSASESLCTVNPQPPPAFLATRRSGPRGAETHPFCLGRGPRRAAAGAAPRGRGLRQPRDCRGRERGGRQSKAAAALLSRARASCPEGSRVRFASSMSVLPHHEVHAGRLQTTLARTDAWRLSWSFYCIQEMHTFYVILIRSGFVRGVPPQRAGAAASQAASGGSRHSKIQSSGRCPMLDTSMRSCRTQRPGARGTSSNPARKAAQMCHLNSIRRQAM